MTGGGVEPARGLQGKRARFAQDGGKCAGMQGFLHDTQDLGVLRAIHPDDAGGIEAKARETWRVAIGAGRGPEEKAIAFA